MRQLRRKGLSLLCIVALLASIASSAAAATRDSGTDASGMGTYRLQTRIDKKLTGNWQVGDQVQVQVVMIRTDSHMDAKSDECFTLYAMQDEIAYDNKKVEFVEVAYRAPHFDVTRPREASGRVSRISVNLLGEDFDTGYPMKADVAEHEVLLATVTFRILKGGSPIYFINSNIVVVDEAQRSYHEWIDGGSVGENPFPEGDKDDDGNLDNNPENPGNTPDDPSTPPDVDNPDSGGGSGGITPDEPSTDPDPDPNPGGGGGGGGVIRPPAGGNEDTGNVEIIPRPGDEEDGKTEVEVPDGKIDGAINDIGKAEKEVPGSTDQTVTIIVKPNGSKEVTVTVKTEDIQKMIDAEHVKFFEIVTEVGDLLFDKKALEAIVFQAAGKTVTFGIKLVTPGWSLVGQDHQSLLAERPGWLVSITSGGVPIIDLFDGRVTASLPYTCGEEEDGYSLLTYKGVQGDAYAEGGSGSVSMLRKSAYDLKASRMKAQDHQVGIFLISHNPKEYTDLHNVLTEGGIHLANHWGLNYARLVTAHALFLGTGSKSFSPDTVMTRGMFVTVLGRLHEVDVSEYTGSSFSDVNASEFYAPYVAWASANGICNGRSNGKFDPDAEVTRVEMATIIYNYAKFEGRGDVSAIDATKLKEFSDYGAIQAWAEPAMSYAINTGIMTGRASGVVALDANATRAEVSVIFMRYIYLTLNISR